MNPDLQKERSNAAVDVESLKEFLGEMLIMSKKRYIKIRKLSK